MTAIYVERVEGLTNNRNPLAKPAPSAGKFSPAEKNCPLLDRRPGWAAQYDEPQSPSVIRLNRVAPQACGSHAPTELPEFSDFLLLPRPRSIGSFDPADLPPVHVYAMVGDSRQPTSQATPLGIEAARGSRRRQESLLHDVGHRCRVRTEQPGNVPPDVFAIPVVKRSPSIPTAVAQTANHGGWVIDLKQGAISGV